MRAGATSGAHRTSANFMNGSGIGPHSPAPEKLDEIINQMGIASAKAQKLPTSITSGSKFWHTDNKIIFRVINNFVIGFLKMGKRNLFYRGFGGQIREIKPLCVLDFYVHENVQRGGHGRAIFDLMLNLYREKPEKLAYDRPSEKLLAFNAKHFGLKRYVPQNNNFVVYDAYFETAPKPLHH